ncbi:hypothetical protein DL98DRAFT_592552 [Cadophora sp. DSE1049]|nr:hypothetical protein DL98DRAFT_592552 [Cadophora sp. DSE1049]
MKPFVARNAAWSISLLHQRARSASGQFKIDHELTRTQLVFSIRARTMWQQTLHGLILGGHYGMVPSCFWINVSPYVRSSSSFWAINPDIQQYWQCLELALTSDDDGTRVVTNNSDGICNRLSFMTTSVVYEAFHWVSS